jgi:hypothetical protein
MLAFFTVVIMLAVGYAFLGEGLFTAAVMFCNVIIAGLLAFNFFEPLADALDSAFAGSFLADYLDLLCLIGIFSLVLGLLRMGTNNLAPQPVEYQGMVRSVGGALFGLMTGYLVAGFLVCALQTLPWHENFMGFDPRYESGQGLRRVLPPDRVWLGLMNRAGAYALSNNVDPAVESPDSFSDGFVRKYLTFDKYGTFEQRYARYRRYANNRGPLPYSGELDSQLQRAK